MPTYEYNCSGCCHDFTAYKRMSERNDATPCELCGKPARRVLSGFAVAGQSAKGKGSSPTGARRRPPGGG